MADSDFNFGPNFPPGGAPENARVNNAAFDAELKKAQQLQADTIKSLTETIQQLSRQYEELNTDNKKLSEDETRAAKLLRDKIDALTEVLGNVQKTASSGVAPAPLSGVGVKERTETFTRLTTVIKDYQRSASELKGGGKEMDFDSWFDEYIEQQKIDQLNLQEQKYNALLLNDVKSLLKQSNTSLSNLSEDELEELASRSIQLSIEQKQRELQVIQQNKDIIKLNKDANAQEIANTKQLIESRKYDPTKPIIELGFKSISKDLQKVVENTKPRSLLKIVLDLMGPFGAVIGMFIKFVVYPLMFTLGLLSGFFLVQFAKFKTIGNLLSGELFLNLAKSISIVKNALLFVFGEMPLIISSFINKWAVNSGKLFSGMNKTSKFFDFIAKSSEVFFMSFVKLTQFISKIPSDLSRLYQMLKTYENSIGGLKIFGKVYTIVGDFISGMGRLVGGLTRILSPLQSVGIGIGKVAASMSQFVTGLFAPITRFFSSGLGRILLIIDQFGFNIQGFLSWGTTIGRYLGGILGPLTAIIAVLTDIPVFFKKIFTGNFYTIMKSIMALIVQIAGLALATIFGGPLGGLVAALSLKLENIMKWFDPIFDFLIYTGGLIFDFIWSVYRDFVDPALGAISKVIMSILNLSFALLKPVFKFGQFLIILLAPLFFVIKQVFKGLGFVFKAIGDLADGLTTYIIDPFFKLMNDFMFKFIQPFYDFIADSFIGKMLGMETKKERLKREAKERQLEQKEKAAKQIYQEEKEKFGFGMPSLDIGKGIDTQGIHEGIGKTKEFVGEAVDKSADVIRSTMSNLNLSISGLGDRLRDFVTHLKAILLPITAGMVGASKAFGVRAVEMGETAVRRLDTPEVRGVLNAATTPINYGTAKTLTPAYSPTQSQSSEDLKMFVDAMKAQSAVDKEKTAGIINNQQTTVVNNTSGGFTMTMPSNSEKTANQINSSVRPAG